MKGRGSNIGIVLIIFFLGIIGGAFVYSFVESWNLLDSFYFVVVTATTVGYGDFFPLTNVGKIFTIFFSFFGVATALYVFSSISSSLFKRHVGAKVSELKRDVRKEDKLKEEVKEVIKKAVSNKGKRKIRR